MARVDINATALVPGGSIPQPAGVSGNADGHRVLPPTSPAWPNRTIAVCERWFLRITVANATTTVTVKAGDKPPALEAKDTALALPVGTHLVGPFTSGKHAKRDGSIHVDYSTAANVSGVAVVAFPNAT